PDHDLVLGRVAERLDDDVLAAAWKGLVHRGAHLLHADRLIELDDHHGAAGELDAQRNPLRHEDDGAGDDDDPRQGDGMPAPAQEVEVRAFEDMHWLKWK